MILTCDQMRRSEERLFASGTEAEPLMDRAGLGLAGIVRQFFPEPGRVEIYVGKGNNGGDTLVAGRHLVQWGWSAKVVLAADREELSTLTGRKLQSFEGARGEAKGVVSSGAVVRLDGLLGIGASGPLRGRIAECAREINRLRLTEGGATVAVDIPTGLSGDSGEVVEDAVVADITVTMAQVKAGLVADCATNYVGRIAIVPLDEIVPIEGDDGVEVVEPRILQGRLSRRDFETHKTMVGRVAVVAGSRGFAGATLLCAQGALRAGGGLVTLFVLDEIYSMIVGAAAAIAPEIMVTPVPDFGGIGGESWDVLAVGPGLGMGRAASLIDLVRNDARPMVLDADMLNAISAAGPETVIGKRVGDRLLTPHPGEMKRLWGEHPAERRETAETFAERFPVALLLKGARSLIAESGRPTVLNTTGHPGMASGGMGDVLTGICAALVAQGQGGYEAATVGAWLLGRSAEIAVSRRDQSVESTTASDVVKHLGRAFDDLRRGCY